MPTTSLLLPRDVSPADEQVVLDSLQQLFAAPFALRQVTRPLTGRRPTGEHLWQDTPGGNSDDINAQVHAAYAAGEPHIVPLGDDRWRLCIPRVLSDWPLAVAVGEVHDSDPHRVQRMVQLWCLERTAERRARQAERENEYLAVQIADDLEELTFLRTMVEKLDVGDASQDLMTLADSTLPLLCESVLADGLCLLRTIDDAEPLLAVPEQWFGRHQVNDIIVARLLQWFGESALRQPVVKNRLSQSPEGSLMPGIDQFVLVPLASADQRLGWLLAIRKAPALSLDRQEHSREFGSSEASLLVTSATILASHARNLQLYQEKELLIVSVVRAMVSAIEAKDDYTRGHSERVARFAQQLARDIGYDTASCERIYLAGLVHDLGKIGVSDAVLKKMDRLSAEEFAEIKRHPEEGWAILHELRPLGYVLPGVLYHHERWDGQGYPDGLAGEQIPLDGRVIAVVDAYDAMTSDRPYRKGMPIDKAQQLLRDGAGQQWDPRMVEAFFRSLDAIEAIRTSYRPSPRPVRLPGILHRGCQLPPAQ